MLYLDDDWEEEKVETVISDLGAGGRVGTSVIVWMGVMNMVPVVVRIAY